MKRDAYTYQLFARDPLREDAGRPFVRRIRAHKWGVYFRKRNGLEQCIATFQTRELAKAACLLAGKTGPTVRDY